MKRGEKPTVCLLLSANCEVQYNKGDCFYWKALLFLLPAESKVLKERCVFTVHFFPFFFFLQHNIHIDVGLQATDLPHALALTVP